MAMIEGFITGIIRDAETGEFKRKFEGSNHISDYMLDYLATTTGTLNENMGPNIYITDLPYKSTDRQKVPFGSFGNIDIRDTVVTSPVATPGTITPKVPFVLAFHNRFNPPAADRDINAVGLTSATVITNNNYILKSSACVGLTSTCVQTTTETLDIFYRVQFSWEYDWVNDSGPTFNDYGNTYYQAEVLYHWARDDYPLDWPVDILTGYRTRDVRQVPIVDRNNDAPHDGHSGGESKTGSDLYGRSIMTATGGLSNFVGQMIGTFYYGAGGQQSAYGVKAVPPGTSPIQNMFSHSATATLPFFDATKIAAGDGTLALGGDSWTNPDCGKLYRIEITKTGAIGTAEYQIWRRSCIGFYANYYRNTARLVDSSYLSAVHNTYDGFNLCYDDVGDNDSPAPRFVPYVNGDAIGKCLAIRADAVLLWDVLNETGTHFNSTNYGTFAPTSIVDYAIETNGDIYIACKNTGLYKISDPEGTPVVTLIDDTTTGLTGAAGPQVYGVAAGRNDRLWVLMDGGLFYSDNSGTSWTGATFSFTGISDSNWSKVIQMHADIEHVDDRLALVFGTVATTFPYEICWYDLNSTTTVQGPYVTYSDDVLNLFDGLNWGPSVPHTQINLMIASRTQGKWGTTSRRSTANVSTGRPAYFSFGTTSVTQTAGAAEVTSHAAATFVTDDDGNQSLYAHEDYSSYMILYKDTDVETRVLIAYTGSNTGMTQYDGHSSNSAGVLGLLNTGGACWLGDGILLCYQDKTKMNIGQPYAVTPDGDPVQGLYTKYGWEGSPGAWVKDSSGSKITQSSEEDITDGLTIQFDDAVGTQTFVAGDYYTVGVFDGIWMDGSTTYTHQGSIYYRPIQKQTELQISTITGDTVYPGMYTEFHSGALTWQDTTANISSDTDGIRQNTSYGTSDYSRGGRTNESVGGPVPTSPGNSLNDTHVLVKSVIYPDQYAWDHLTTGAQMVWGISETTVAGNAITYGGIQYGFGVDGRAYSGDYMQYTIVESGVVKKVIDGAYYYNVSSAGYELWMEIRVQLDGSVEYSLGGALVHTSPAGTVADVTVSFLIDFASHGDAGAEIEQVEMHGPLTAAGPYFEFGAAGSPGTGRYVDDFYKIELGQTTFLIDGVNAPFTVDDTLQTVPPTGELTVSRTNGYFRVAAGDVGKAISAEYFVVTH